MQFKNKSEYIIREHDLYNKIKYYDMNIIHTIQYSYHNLYNLSSPKNIQTVITGPNMKTIATVDSGDISVEDLPALAYPAVEFIDELRPNLVIAADRGGRMYGLSVFKLWQKLKDKPFPTLDHKLHFGRLTKKDLTDQEIRGILEDALFRSVKYSSDKPGALDVITGSDTIKVVLIDDWIVAGGTRDRVEAALQSIASGLQELTGVEVKFVLYTAVMCGRGADITGSKNRQKYCEWQDNDYLAGVTYEKGSAVPVVHNTAGAVDLRRRLSDAIQDFDPKFIEIS